MSISAPVCHYLSPIARLSVLISFFVPLIVLGQAISRAELAERAVRRSLTLAILPVMVAAPCSALASYGVVRNVRASRASVDTTLAVVGSVAEALLPLALALGSTLVALITILFARLPPLSLTPTPAVLLLVGAAMSSVTVGMPLTPWLREPATFDVSMRWLAGSCAVPLAVALLYAGLRPLAAPRTGALTVRGGVGLMIAVDAVFLATVSLAVSALRSVPQ